MNKRSFLFIISFFSAMSFTLAQGKLVLVGGGGESQGGWSDLPYEWVVNNAANNRIGIISYSEADEWLPNYFKSLGAVAADNIMIASRESAQTSAIYDSLNSYDALFFKGGDQNLYYQYYKDTPVQEAMESIYARGGVIGGTSAGMAILSGVLFTATEGSAYPVDALEDINSAYINLQDDFLPFYPNYIFDTHFIERGRQARLIGFLAHWYSNNNELINGIGVDDRTAFCIDENGVGTVYGTGAASIYKPVNFEIENDQIVDSNVKAIQLTHGHSYNLKEEKALERMLTATSLPAEENAFYNIFGSGTSSFSENQELLEEVVQSDLLPGKVLIIANEKNLLTEAYLNFFNDNLEEEVVVITTDAVNNNQTKASVRNSIRKSGLVVVLEGADLPTFIAGGPTGALLASHMKRNKVTSLFLGQDVVPLISKSYSINIYSDPFNAYYNELEFTDGLALLPQFTIAAKAYELNAKDYYENVTSSVLDQLLRGQLLYGIYLTGNSYFSYRVNQSSEAVLSTGGDIPSVIVCNSATSYQQTSQEVNDGISRLQYAFDSLTYRIIKGVNISIGTVEAKDQEEYEMEEEEVLANQLQLRFQNVLIENPVTNYLKFSDSLNEIKEVQVYDMSGRLLLEEKLPKNKSIKIGFLANGKYNVVAKDIKNKIYYLNKIVKTN